MTFKNRKKIGTFIIAISITIIIGMIVFWIKFFQKLHESDISGDFIMLTGLLIICIGMMIDMIIREYKFLKDIYYVKENWE